MPDMPDIQALRKQAAGGTFCIVPYCHPDFAWTHHREWHEERYSVSTAEALDLMAQRQEFRFCMEPWIDHVIPFLERCPDRIEDLRARLNSGQMGVQAFTLTSPRPATCPDESFLRNMILGRKQYQSFAPSARLDVMSCPDVGIGHSQMPQVCRLAGAGMYRGWRSDSALSYKGVPRDFLWRGLDGTEMITSRGCYGGLVNGALMPADFASRWDEVTAQLFDYELRKSLENSTTHTWWVAQGMDDARPLRVFPTDELLPIFDFTEEWNRREESRMVLCTPNEYLDRLREENLPVWKGLLDPVDVAYNSGWHGVQGLWRLRQEFDAAMVLAERACALASIAGHPNVAGPERLEKLWVECVRIMSHALQWIFNRDWDWLLSRARWELRRANEEADRAIAALAQTGRRSGGPRPLVLFNPLPVDREEVVEVAWVQPRQDAAGYRVTDADGNELPLQLGEQWGETWGDRIVEAPLIFRARVPAMSVAVYNVTDGPAPAATPSPDGDLLDNGRLQVQLSPRGIQRIHDPVTGIQWSAPVGSCIGDCRLHEMADGVLHIGPITGEMSGREGHGRWVLSGPIRWVYRWETSFHDQRVVQDVIVDRDAPHIDLLTRVFCPGANGFFALCLDLPIGGDLNVDIPFGVEPRDLADEPYAMDMPPSFHNIERHRRNQFWARSFASISDGECAISIITVDGDKYWTWDADQRRLRHILFTPLDDVDHGANWEGDVTKARLALGWHDFRHRIILHPGDWRTAGICGQSDAARVPLRAVKPLGPAPEAREEPSAPGGMAICPASVRISAFYETDRGFVLRLYECAGETTEARVILPAPFLKAARTDFNLEPLDAPVILDEAELRLPLRPWEIATIKLVR